MINQFKYLGYKIQDEGDESLFIQFGPNEERGQIR